MTLLGGFAGLCRVDIADTLRRRRFQGMSALFALVTVWAAILAVERHRGEIAGQERRDAALHAVLASSTVGEAARFWLPACKPPWELALVIDGGQAAVPDCYLQQVIAWETPRLVRAGERNPRLPAMAPLDWMFAVSSILFLAACLAFYDAVAGERSSGLLRLTFSYPVPRWKYLAAKLVSGWICLSLTLLLGFSLSLLVGFLGMPEVFTPQNLAKIAAVTALCLWAALLFVVVSVLASLCVRDPANSLMALLILWMTWVIVVPALAAVAARHLVAIPVDTEIERQLAEISDQIRQENEGRGSGWRGREGGRRDSYLWERRSVDAENRRFYRQERLRRAVSTAKLRQARTAEDLAAAFSPPSLIRSLAARLAGTGPLRDEAFLRQAWHHRKVLEARLRGLDARDPASPHLLFFTDYMSERPLGPGAIPEFRFREQALAEGLAASLPALGWLALETLMLAMVSGLALRYLVQHATSST